MLEALDADRGSEFAESLPVMRARATSLVRYGGFRSGLGRYNEAIASISHGIVMMRDVDATRELGLALNMLAAAHQMKGELPESRRLLEESPSTSERRTTSGALRCRSTISGCIFICAEKRKTPSGFAKKAGKCSGEIGDRRGNAFATYNLGMIAARNGDHERARRWYRESLTLRQDSHDQWGIAASRFSSARDPAPWGHPRNKSDVPEGTTDRLGQFGDTGCTGCAGRNVCLADR